MNVDEAVIAVSIADVWIQGTIALVTLGGIVASIWIARSGQKNDLETAKGEADRAERADAASQAASERAEAASRLSIDTMTRIADALDKLAAEGINVGDLHVLPGTVAPVPAKVSWALSHFQGDTYLLENTGDASAFDVVLSADETLLQRGEWQRAGEMKPGEAIKFMAVRTMGTRDSTITVEWRNSSEGDVQTWRYPLPPRPPRR